ncbi:MAG: tetratricopeptide repeat protein [Planctomycetota bacterium]
MSMRLSSRTLAGCEQTRRLQDQAQLAMWAFMPDEAYEHADAALQLNPSDPMARLMQARVQLQRSRPADALRSLDAHDQFGQGMATASGDGQPSQNLEAMCVRAASLAQAGQTSMAIAQLEELIELAPADLSLLRALGSLQLRDAREAEAIETFALICDLDRHDAVSARVLSDLMADHAPSRSVEVLRRGDTGNGLRIARRCEKAGRLLEAESHYAELLEAHGDEGWLWLEAASLSMRMGELTRAEERLMNAVQTQDGQGAMARQAWSNFAIQAGRRGRVAAAGRAWWRAIRAEGSAYPEGWAGLLTCAMLAERDTLMRRVDRTLRGMTTRSQRRAMLSKRWLDTVPPRFADAGSRLRLTVDVSPLTSLILHASDVVGEHVVRYPGRADARFHHAVLREAQGDVDGALEEAGVALSINPTYEAASGLCDRLAA